MDFPVGGAVTIEELIADPHAVNHRLRPEEPVSWVPALDGWLVTVRELAIEVMRDDVRYTVDDPRFTTGQIVGPSMLSLDGPEHRRHRLPFSDAYRGGDIRARLTAFASDTARRLVGDVRPDGAGDLRAALAGPLAVEVMTESLGLDATAAQVLAMYRAIVTSVESLSAGGDVVGGAVEAMDALAEAVRGAVHRDSQLLQGPIASLAMDEVVSNVAVVMFGGVETSEGMIANVLWHLLSHPEQLEAVRADRSLVVGAVEESLRLEPAATRVDRYATEDVVLAGAEIAKGDLVIASLAGANRDPAVFADPDRFDVHRPDARSHVTFAQGPHICLANHVARMEAVEAVTAVLDLIPDVSLDEDSVAPTGLVFRKPDRLPVTWTAA